MSPSVSGTRSRKRRGRPVMRGHRDLGQEFAVDSKCDNTGLDLSLKISLFFKVRPTKRNNEDSSHSQCLPRRGIQMNHLQNF